MTETTTDILILLLLLLPPLDWIAAAILAYIARRNPDILTLRERAVAALISALVASIAGVLAWAYFGFLELPPGSMLGLLALGLVMVSVPNLYWLALLATGRFRVGGP